MIKFFKYLDAILGVIFKVLLISIITVGILITPFFGGFIIGCFVTDFIQSRYQNLQMLLILTCCATHLYLWYLMFYPYVNKGV